MLQPEVTGQGKKLVLKQFLRPDTDNGTVVILNGGREPVEYEIQCDNPGIFFDKKSGRLETRDEITVSIDKKTAWGKIRLL